MAYMAVNVKYTVLLFIQKMIAIFHYITVFIGYWILDQKHKKKKSTTNVKIALIISLYQNTISYNSYYYYNSGVKYVDILVKFTQTSAKYIFCQDVYVLLINNKQKCAIVHS